MSVLVLEASTSSAKAMVYDAEHGIISMESTPYPNEVSDVATHDVDGVFEALITAGKKAACGRDIDVIALGGTWHSMVMLDRDMKPVTRGYTWAYTGAAPVAGKLRQDADLVKKVYSSTGCMVHTIYPAFKYIHVKKELDLPDGLLCAGQSDYNFYKMTGCWNASHSLASGTALMNTHTLDWDDDMLKLTGLSRDRLPKLVDHTMTEPLISDIAARLGVKAGIPVVPPHPDGALNQVGAGAMGSGVMTLSVGTSGALRMAFDHPVMPDTPGGTWCYVGPGKWICGAATSGATNCVDWLVKTVFGGRFSFAELEQMAKDVDGDYPVFTPFLYGERCPGWRDDALGSFADIDGHYGPGHLYRGLLEGILMNICHCFKILGGVGGYPEHIRVSGGILNSPFWTQMLADILGREIECADMEQASLMGGAALGLLAEGKISDLGDFDPGDIRVISPDMSMKEHYEKRFDRYMKLYKG